MRRPLLYSSLLAGTLLATAAYFTLGFPDIPFLENAYSTIVDLPTIFPYFVPAAIAFAVALTLFLHLSFRAVGHETPLVKGILAALFAAGIVLILTPYDHALLGYWFLHTIAAFTIAGLIVTLGLEFRKVQRPKEKALAWLQRHLPPVMGIGTLGIFLAAGISMLMETYFFILASAWLMVMGLTIREAQQNP